MKRLGALSVVVLVLAGASVMGCRSESASTEKSQGSAQSHGHAHGHHHGHGHGDTGPHGGHLVEFDEEGRYHAEWVHDDQGSRVTVYLLGPDAKEEVAIAAESVTIETQVEGKEPQQYVLEAVNPQDGKASQFERQDPALLAALNVGKGVTSTLQVEIEGQSYRGTIEHHHDEHGHHHH